MQLSTIHQAFNRAFIQSFCTKRLCLIAISLFSCALIFIGALLLKSNSLNWVNTNLIFLPFFLSFSLLMPTAVLNIILYKDAIQSKPLLIKETLSENSEMLRISSYFPLPLLLGYLIFWLLSGLFILLMKLPSGNLAFRTFLSFAPFVLNLGSLLLFFMASILLFTLPPLIVFKKVPVKNSIFHVIEKLLYDPFSHIILAAIASLPLLLSIVALYLSFFLTHIHISSSLSTTFFSEQTIFLLLPISILLAPSFLFFFNFSAEAYQLVSKIMRPKEQN